MDILYKRIRERRESLGMSQEELAIKTGYTSRSSIAKIEKGLVDLQQSKIVAMADALHTTPAYLMGWVDEIGNVTADEATVDDSVEILIKKIPASKMEEVKRYLLFQANDKEN